MAKYAERLLGARLSEEERAGMLSTRSMRLDTRMDSVEDALAALRDGRMVVVVDDKSRENEGDLILPAATATTEQLAFAIRHSTGIICTPMTAQELDRLGIPMMTEHNTDPKRTAFTLSADARTGVTTGVSAADRARTIVSWRTRAQRRPTSSTPATSSPCVHARAGSSRAAVTRRPPSTSCTCRATDPWASSWRSSTTTAPWRADTSCESSPTPTPYP